MKNIVGKVKSGSYVVVFSSHEGSDLEGYAEMADRMMALAEKQPGFIGVESVRESDGHGITVSYWEDEEAIRRWKQNAKHREAQARGQAQWYAAFDLHVCRIERSYGSQ